MQKLKIWFDLDGVLVPSVEWVEDLVSVEIQRPFRFTEYNPEDMDIEPHVVEIVYRHFDPKIMGSVPPTKEMIQLVSNLKQFCDVGILTARVPSDQGLYYTYKQCLSNFGIEPILAGNARKRDILEQNGVHIFVEDCLQTARDLVGSFTLPVILSRRYNMAMDEPNLVRVYTPYQIYNLARMASYALQKNQHSDRLLEQKAREWNGRE